MDFIERAQTFQEFVLSPKFDDKSCVVAEVRRSVVKTKEDGEVTLAWKGTGEMIWRRIRDPGDCRHILQTNDALMPHLKFLSLGMNINVERICAIYKPMQTAIEHNWVREHASTRDGAVGGPAVGGGTGRVSALLQQLCDASMLSSELGPDRLLS